MSENPYESELLEYVEDALDPTALAALRARLAADDELREKLEQLRRDRMLLRSLGEPELPADFIASLEPALARSLLIDPQPDTLHHRMGEPGVYRRRHRAASRRWRVGRYAFAAIVLVALGAGIWITATLRSSMTPSPGSAGPGAAVAVRPAAPSPAGDSNERAGAPGNALADGNVDDSIDPGADVHHWGPLPMSPSATNAAVASGVSGAIDDRPPVLTAPLVLVLSGGDVEAAEALLQLGVSDLATGADLGTPSEMTAALVRNFSMAEARRLEERYFPAAAREPAPIAVTGLGTGDPDGAGAANTRRRRERYARMLDSLRDRSGNAADEPILESGLLYGTDGLAPYDKQLELSGRGATHTIAIPRASFATLLRNLHRLDGPSVTLRSFDGWSATDVTTVGDALDVWVAESRVIAAFRKTLRDPDVPGSMLLVPVVIE